MSLLVPSAFSMTGRLASSLSISLSPNQFGAKSPVGWALKVHTEMTKSLTFCIIDQQLERKIGKNKVHNMDSSDMVFMGGKEQNHVFG